VEARPAVGSSGSSGSSSGSGSGSSTGSSGGNMYPGSFGTVPTGAALACPTSRKLAWYLNDFTGNWEQATAANIAFGQPPKGPTTNWTADTDPTHGGTIKINYPAHSSSNTCYQKGGCSVSGGFEFKVPLPNGSAQSSAYLSYWIEFDPGWSWGNSLAAGKLPGFCGGNCPSGATVANGMGYSARFMWRSGGGEVLAYAVSPSGSTGADIPSSNPPGGWTFAKSGWQHIGLEVEMNTGTNADGSVKVWYNADPNGTPTFSHGNIEWYKSFPGGVGWFQFSTFFGGDTASDGPPTDVTAHFADFQVCY
jgi:hypothetical protein